MNAKIFVTNYTFDNQLKRKETLILLYWYIINYYVWKKTSH